jgi:hypothetical protein
MDSHFSVNTIFLFNFLIQPCSMLQGLPLVQLTTHIGTGNVLHHAFQEAEASEIQGQITCFSSKKSATKLPFLPPTKNKLVLHLCSELTLAPISILTRPSESERACAWSVLSSG